MVIKSSVVSLAVALLFASPASLKTLTMDLDKSQVTSTADHVELLLQQAAKSVPVNLLFTSSPYIYTSSFTFGSNNQKAKMRFTTDTDWTMVTGTECYRCVTKAYNSSSSITAKNGTYYKPENEKGGMKYAGTTVKDMVCIDNNSGDKKTACVEDFEFFVIRN
jgi:hypothetical protein